MSKEKVNHPDHYNAGGIECIDALDSATAGLEGVEAFDTANSIKYLWRWKHKNGVEDLKKAIWYIQHLIDKLTGTPKHITYDALLKMDARAVSEVAHKQTFVKIGEDLYVIERVDLEMSIRTCPRTTINLHKAIRACVGGMPVRLEIEIGGN